MASYDFGGNGGNGDLLESQMIFVLTKTRVTHISNPFLDEIDENINNVSHLNKLKWYIKTMRFDLLKRKERVYIFESDDVENYLADKDKSEILFIKEQYPYPE